MPTPLALIPPLLLKRILELDGYECVSENPVAWVMLHNNHLLPIPKIGTLVDFEVMETALHAAKIDHKKYLELKAKALGQATMAAGAPREHPPAPDQDNR